MGPVIEGGHLAQSIAQTCRLLRAARWTVMVRREGQARESRRHGLRVCPRRAWRESTGRNLLLGVGAAVVRRPRGRRTQGRDAGRGACASILYTPASPSSSVSRPSKSCSLSGRVTSLPSLMTFSESTRDCRRHLCAGLSQDRLDTPSQPLQHKFGRRWRLNASACGMLLNRARSPVVGRIHGPVMVGKLAFEITLAEFSLCVSAGSGQPHFGNKELSSSDRRLCVGGRIFGCFVTDIAYQ